MDTSPHPAPERADPEPEAEPPDADPDVIDLTDPADDGAEARPAAAADAGDRFVVGWAIEDLG